VNLVNPVNPVTDVVLEEQPMLDERTTFGVRFPLGNLAPIDPGVMVTDSW
jgi:hypothetical protein